MEAILVKLYGGRHYLLQVAVAARKKLAAIVTVIEKIKEEVKCVIVKQCVVGLLNATISQSAVCNRQRILEKRACSIESTGITPQAYQAFSSSLLFPYVSEYSAAFSSHFCVWYSWTFPLHQMTPLSLAHLSQTPRHTFSQPDARAVWISDAEPFLMSVHTFSVGHALSTFAGRWLLRTTTLGTDRSRQSLLTRRTHLMLFH